MHEVLTCRDPRLGKSGRYWTEIARWLGHGLLTSDGPQWVRQRRTVSPMFAHAQLGSWQAVLEQEAEQMAEELAVAAPTTIDLSPPAVRMALRAISRTVFGTDNVAAECGRLTWPRVVRLSSSVLAPPSGVVVVAGGVSSSVLAPPLDG